MGNCLVGQSGGPTAVINASLCGVIKAGIKDERINKVYGAVNGIQGFLNENICDLSEIFSDSKKLDVLKITPSAYLGSCRYKLKENDTETFEKIFKLFSKYDITSFFYIGGNDSMDTVYKLSAYAKEINYPISIIGVPKTIDNDLDITDHTPGFGSAAKYIAASILEITHDSEVYDTNSVTIIEIMGRNAGWLAASSALARNEISSAPHLIYLPEVPFSIDKFIEDVKEANKKHKNVIVAISEGIKDENGVYVCETTASGLTDTFGHKYLSGSGKVLENAVREKLGFKARAVELNVLQRCASHISSLTDINEAEEIGMKAVEEALAGSTGKMMIFVRENCSDYKLSIKSHDITNIANAEKIVPESFISESGNDVTEAFMDYAKPLILGEPKIEYKDGLPVYIKLNK